MKDRNIFFAPVLFPVLAFFLAACASTPEVTRVASDTRTDLSGYWNDTDVRIVCDSLIDSCLNDPMVAEEIARRGRLPVFMVGKFENNSDEHIDTSIISSTMENAIFRSRRANFVAGGDTSKQIRDERQDQQSNASEESAKALGNETGADFLLTGSVKTIVDRAGGTISRTYYVSAKLTDIENGTPLWMDQNSEIKKIIKIPGAKL